ncbi:Peptidase M28 [uncultured Caudovirales phage]|uniref:Peptidase M28 n=1 Tax=uncultured Caudovirales phage TaxID=2100421 RepID=A0A6J5M0D8_9CAUD|nr:Peptidase M28 [uncultured Caudovirales phage]
MTNYSQSHLYSAASYSYAAALGPVRSKALDADQRPAMLAGTKRLIDILSWRRPHDSQAEQQFTDEYLMPLIRHPNVTGFNVDGFGNIWVAVGPDAFEAPLLFSCHIDTVSSAGGRQAIGWSRTEQDVLQLISKKAGRSLGADDGAGLWLLLEMMDANVAGQYVFHRGEEKGRLGSLYVARNEPWRLDKVQACIAFDRRDHDNLITHQMGERGCSTSFATSLIDSLLIASNGQLLYREDDTGSYTDSYSYFDLVPECTNLSIGYDGEHGPRETLDVAHVWRLRQAIVQADLGGLSIERDPTASAISYLDETYDRFGDWRDWRQPTKTSYRDFAPTSSAADDWDELADLLALVCNYPDQVAEMLQDLGIAPWNIIEELPTGEQARALTIINQ